MASRKAYSLLIVNDAVVGQPVYLLIVVMISAICLTFIGISLQPVLRDGPIQQVESQIDVILTESSHMFEYADEGSMVHLQIDFPSSLRFIVFGSLPKNSTMEPSDRTLDENTSNNYYFVMDDGIIRMFHSNARFSNRNNTEIVVLHPGRYTLAIGVVRHEGKTYVTMST